VKQAKLIARRRKFSPAERLLLIEKTEEVLRDMVPSRAGWYRWFCSFSDQFVFNTREREMVKVRNKLAKGFVKEQDELELEVTKDLKKIMLDNREDEIVDDVLVKKWGTGKFPEDIKYEDLPRT